MSDVTPIDPDKTAPNTLLGTPFRSNKTRRFDHSPEEHVSGRMLINQWNAARRGLDLPHRADIDPPKNGGLLAHTFILERIAPNLARFRVAGAHLADLMGMDVRGMPISALMLPEARAELGDALAHVFETPGVLRADLRAPGRARRPELCAELVILPLRNDGGWVTRAIGCLIAQGQIGLVPRRFEVMSMHVGPVLPAMPQIQTSQRTPPMRPKTRLAPVKPGHPSYLRLVISD